MVSYIFRILEKRGFRKTLICNIWTIVGKAIYFTIIWKTLENIGKHYWEMLKQLSGVRGSEGGWPEYFFGIYFDRVRFFSRVLTCLWGHFYCYVFTLVRRCCSDGIFGETSREQGGGVLNTFLAYIFPGWQFFFCWRLVYSSISKAVIFGISALGNLCLGTRGTNPFWEIVFAMCGWVCLCVFCVLLLCWWLSGKGQSVRIHIKLWG